VEQREREEFDRFAEQQTRISPTGPGLKTFEEFIGDAGMTSAAVVQNRIASRAPLGDSEDEDIAGETAGEPGSPGEIVTVTLAEIYAAQGQYEEAVSAYRKLLDRRPDEADRFRKRIAVLEALAAASDTETPLQE
jgi:tetratricopeptide (TPR) repeat protein